MVLAQAAILEQIDASMQCYEIDVADPESSEVRISTKASGICHTDLHALEGGFPARLPTVLGHEASGIVEAIGPDVTHVKVGDHVITCLSTYCGDCERCLSGRPYLCLHRGDFERREAQRPRLSLNHKPIHQFLRVSSFASRMLVHERSVVKVPEALPFSSAALIGCAVLTGVGAAFRTARVKPGSSVAVLGCGGVGLNCIQGAYLAGAGAIIALDLEPRREQLAEKMGATTFIDLSGGGDPVTEVRRLFPLGVDYAFDSVGVSSTVEHAFNMTASGGIATIVGVGAGPLHLDLPHMAFLSERRLQGCNMGSNRFRIDVPRLADLYLRGRLQLDELVSMTFTLEDVGAAIEALKHGEVARAVLTFA